MLGNLDNLNKAYIKTNREAARGELSAAISTQFISVH